MIQSRYVTIQIIVGIILVAIYLSLLIVEQKWPLRKPTRPLLSRIVINFTFTIFVYLIASILINPLAQWAINMTHAHQFGFIPFLIPNEVLKFVLGFLLMDLTFYYWHRLNHESSLLWRFHNVHHLDPDLDITTSMRFHIIEIIYSSIFRLVQLTLIGINPLTFICYEFFFQANTFFQHSNLKLPIRIERMVNRIIVTPRMHGIHHSSYRDETNRNYGVIFSFWDRLHKTIKLNVPQQSVIIGIPGYKQLSDNTIVNSLLIPFKPQRRYWQTNNIKFIRRTSPPLEKNIGHLSE